MVANRPTDCPFGHGGSITLWGRREWASAPYRRQRFRCAPSNGRAPHTFSLERRPATHGHPSGEDCLTCDITPGVAQGPLSRVAHFHSAVEIAHLLQLVAEGMSLRRASQTVRLEAHHFVTDGYGMRHATDDFCLAARYLDLFGAVLDEALTPTACPRFLVLNSKPLNLRAYGAEDVRSDWNRAERGGAVMVAIGTDGSDRKPMPWRIGLASDEKASSWRDFLEEIDPGGPGPEWVVADGASAIANAVRQCWPNARFYNCEFHLGRLLREAAQMDGIATEHPAQSELFKRAFWAVADWDALIAFAEARPAQNLRRWCGANDDLIRAQIAAHTAIRGLPRGNGAAEALLDWIDRHFGRNRRFSLRNATRLQLILSLVRAHHAGQADVAVFAPIIKRAMKELPVGARFDWTVRQDPAGELCSIGQLIVDAHDRETKGFATYMAAAKARSVSAIVGAQNAKLAALGHPPLVATVSPGRKTASVKVAGLMLAADFPLVARDWDHVANSKPLETVKAGSGYRAHWRCHRCEHQWVASVAQRTCRQTRCERCVTERADGLNSLAAVHPDLVCEWDTAANAPLRPERIKATYDRTVCWRCPEDPEHPLYRMSPVTRGKRSIGCPLCRKKAAASDARDARVA